jgi:hypothetical protein
MAVPVDWPIWRLVTRLLDCSRSVLRAASGASATVDSVGLPATSSRIRAAKVRVVVGPTFSPKPRSTPRRLISTSWFLVCSKLARRQQRSHFLRDRHRPRERCRDGMRQTTIAEVGHDEGKATSFLCDEAGTH